MKQRETFRLGDLLVKVGAITDEQLKFALELQREKKKETGGCASGSGVCDSKANY